MSPPLLTGLLESDAPHVTSVPPTLILRAGSLVSYPLETRSSEVPLHPSGDAPPTTADMGLGALRTARPQHFPQTCVLSRGVLQAPFQGCSRSRYDQISRASFTASSHAQCTRLPVLCTSSLLSSRDFLVFLPNPTQS